MPIEKVAGRVIGRQPMPVQQKIVHIIGENELLDLDAFFAEASDEVHRLREINVAVVVAMNKKYRRLPGVDGSHGRGITGQLVQIRRDVLSFPVVSRPVVYAVQVHARREQIGVAP